MTLCRWCFTLIRFECFKVKKCINLFKNTNISNWIYSYSISFRFIHKSFFFCLFSSRAHHFSVSNHENLTTWGMIEIYLIMPPSPFSPTLYSMFKRLWISFSTWQIYITIFQGKVKFCGRKKSSIVKFLSHLFDKFSCYPALRHIEIILISLQRIVYFSKSK